MAIDDPRRWLLVSPFRSGRPWSLRVTDEHGRRRELAWPGRGELAGIVRDTVSAGPVPVFFRAVERAPRLNDQVIDTIDPFVRRGEVRLVNLPRAAFEARAPFELPLDVVFLGALDRAIVAPLRDARWLPDDVAAHGLRVATHTLTEYQWLPRQRADIDVAIADADTAHKLLGIARRSWPPRHPRVTVVVDTARALRGEPRRPPPPGVAMVLVPCETPAAAGAFVRELVLQLVHDHPLDEAVARARAALPAGAPAPTLLSDPAANWSVSLSDAHRAITGRAFSLARAMAHAVSPPVAALAIPQMLRDALPDFSQESRGLTTLAQVKAGLDELDARAAGEPASPDPAAAPGSPRYVEIALARTRPAPAGVTTDPLDPMRVLPPTAIAAGRPYRLIVQIGAHLLGGLVVSPMERISIDSLLSPSRDGHRLEVSLLALELGVESAPIVPIWLPRVGASEVATFTVRAPEGFAGTARARVMITYLDRVLQTYVVEAIVAAEELDQALALAARLEHSASPRFEQLDRVRARAAAIVLNDDPRAGSHTIQVKRGADVAACRFTEDQIETLTEGLRGELTAAAGGAAPRFPEPPPTAPAQVAARRAAFAASIRALAKQGAALHRAVMVQVDRKGDPVVRGLRAARDQTIQIVQASGPFSLPWALLYDWATPDAYAAFDALPVCDGAAIIDPPGGAACTHDADSAGVLCCRGFWGLRHQLEQVLADPAGDDPIAEVKGHGAPLRIGLGASVASGGFVPAFAAACAQAAVAIAAGDDVHALLWSGKRPAVLITIGRLTTLGAGATASHQIDLVPALDDAAVANRISKIGRWSDPHSLVMLMACGSAAVPVGALLGLTRVLLGAGAGAVIGSETDVFSGAASRFAEAVRARFAAAERPMLGAAVRAARWELLADHSPVGLTFVAYGNADLRIGAGGST